MKKVLFVLTLGLCMFSCEEATHEGEDTGILLEIRDYNITIEEVTIDGCEYLCGASHERFGITHKGNCSNPIHEHNMLFLNE